MLIRLSRTTCLYSRPINRPLRRTAPYSPYWSASGRTFSTSISVPSGSSSSQVRGHVPIGWQHVDLTVLRTFFRSLWKDFNARFQHIINNLKCHKNLLRDYTNQIHIQNYEMDRLKILEEIEQSQTARSAERRIFVARWIAAPQVLLDHEHLCSVRHGEYEATGRHIGQWILEQGQVKAWLAPQVPPTSALWISAIPGSGAAR